MAPSTEKTEKSSRRSFTGTPFTNGVKPQHVFILVVVLLIRYTYGGVDLRARRSANEELHDLAINNADHHQPQLHKDNEHGHSGEDGEHGHGYQVFHVEFDRVELPFIIALWIFVSSLAKIGFHMTPKLHHIFPESCLLIVVGIIIGFLLFWTSKHEPPSTLTPDVFFLFMLPPIILDAGYFMPNRLFFDHLGTILLMAVVGTIFNAMCIGAALYGCGVLGAFGPDHPEILETFLFSSLISAVDPVAVLAVFEEIHVDEILYIVVFGESLLNDAVTVVLYHMFEAYVDIGVDNIQVNDVLKGFASFLVVALGGTIVGIIWGYVTGFVTRFTNHARILEPLFVFTMAYLSYLNAEIFHLSGIMAITFCGITMKNYVERNISSKSQTTLKYAMKMLSGSSETIIFMFLGVATIHDKHDWNWNFVVLTIFFCTFFRVIGVIILTAIANQYRLHKLSKVDQFVMMYGGLRGAVAFALVLLIDGKKVPHADMFVTTTIAMVYWTVFVQGITIKPLVKFLNVKVASEKDPTMNERIAGRFMDHVVAGMEGILGELGNLRIRDMYKRLDDKYIKPCLLRENHFKDPKIIETYENLTERDALEFMKRNPTQFAELAGSKTMVELNELSKEKTKEVVNVSSPVHKPFNHANRDPKEIHYSQSQKDMDETRIKHMLSENLFMPRNQPRKLSYSRHAIDEGSEVPVNPGVNYKVHMQVRRMMSENKNMRRRQKNRSTEQAVDVPNVSKVNPGARITGASKVLQDDHVHEALQNKSDDNTSAQANFYVSDEDEDDEQFLSLSSRPMKSKKVESMPSPWMLSKTSITGENNRAFIGDAPVDEAIQSKALPWRREDEMGPGYSKVQEEFPPWINNKDYLPYDSPTNTLMGVSKHNSEVPSVIGFFRKDSHVSQSGPASRKNSELEQQHHASLNEAELETRRQKRSLRQFQRKNTYNSTTEDTIPEDETTQSSTGNYTKL